MRTSGILLHPTSLPCHFGIGELGDEALRFVDFLADAGQSLWQILPLGPTGYGNSPYMCFSAFAGNHLLISLEKLMEEDMLTPADLKRLPPFPANRVDYEMVMRFKTPLLEKAFHRFKSHEQEGFEAFCEQNSFWLEDYALFMALKEAHGLKPWTQWDKGVCRRDPDVINKWKNKLMGKVEFQKYLQYLFFRQWFSLKRYCNEKGIQIIGDMPIYIAHDSADVWVHREFFQIDEEGNLPVVAGVPPDYFSATGQRWGNPLYRWDVMAQKGYKWWIDRFRAALGMVDMLRIDHFRGFSAYWEIQAGGDWWDATKGRWVKAPGAELFEEVIKALGKLPVVAEDLGVITPEVEALRDKFGFPGMRILKFAFGNDPRVPDFRPHNHTKNSVVYTGTHDNNTTLGWFNSRSGEDTTQTEEEIKKERQYTLKYLGTDGSEIHWDFIRLAMSSVADIAIIPLQDVLGLGSEARMNRPGTLQSNWEWRYTHGMITEGIKERLRELTIVYERTALTLPFMLRRIERR